MKHPLLLCVVLTTSVMVYVAPEIAVAQTATEAVSEVDAAHPDEAAIRAAIESYVKAFNQGDAKVLASHWGEQGEYVSPSGEELRGRQTLEERFTSYFTDTKGAQLELLETTVELLSPSVAVESGAARIILPSDEPIETDYEAIHVRGPDGWKIDSLREVESAEPPPSHHDQLQACSPTFSLHPASLRPPNARRRSSVSALATGSRSRPTAASKPPHWPLCSPTVAAHSTR